MAAFNMEGERARGCWMVTDWVTIDTSTEEGGGDNEARASWMVLTQLAVKRYVPVPGQIDTTGN